MIPEIGKTYKFVDELNLKFQILTLKEELGRWLYFTDNGIDIIAACSKEEFEYSFKEGRLNFPTELEKALR
jgi:hypothetical protein